MEWFFAVRAFDATPTKIRFGTLQPLLAPVARYWWRDAVPVDPNKSVKPSKAKAAASSLPEWSVIDHEEWLRRNPGRQPKSGTVELLGQTLRCSWMQTSSQGVEVKTSESPVIAPMFLSRANASTICSALEKSFPGLTLAKLQDLCKRVPLVSLALVGDQCGANGRMKHHAAHILAVHNNESLRKGEGVVLLIDVNCCGHVTHGIVSKVFALKELMPRMHAIAFSLSMPNTYSKVVRALRRVVAEDLRLGYFTQTRPPEEFVASTQTILDMTILRFKSTRARSESFTTTSRELKREDLARVLAKLLNGDWARPTVQHFCYGTCCNGQSRETAEEAITAALAEAWFEPISENIPSIARWSTFGDCLPEEVGGMLCHAILPRVMGIVEAELAGEQLEDNAENDDNLDSWQVHITKKLQKAFATLSDQPATTQVWSTALFATEPIDYLSNRLQHLDTVGSSLKELVSENGLLTQFQEHVWFLLNPWSAEESRHSQKLWGIFSYLQRMCGADFDGKACISDLRGYLLSVASAVWARLQLQYFNWPWKLVRGCGSKIMVGHLCWNTLGSRLDGILLAFDLLWVIVG